MDDLRSWDNINLLWLHGFVYDTIHPAAPFDVGWRIMWVEKQNETMFSTQPYEHLAFVYKNIGMEREARQVSVAKHEAIRKYGHLTRGQMFWNWVLGTTIDYGYNTTKIFAFILFMIMLGAIVFSNAYKNQIIMPTKGQVTITENSRQEEILLPYPEFNPIMYSADVFLPIIDLQQEKYWIPNNANRDGKLYTSFMWFHIISGWFFSTIAVGSVTGLLRRE